MQLILPLSQRLFMVNKLINREKWAYQQSVSRIEQEAQLPQRDSASATHEKLTILIQAYHLYRIFNVNLC